MFFWNSLAFSMIQQMLQFDLSFFCLLLNQLEHLEVHGSRTAEAWLGEFCALLSLSLLEFHKDDELRFLFLFKCF